MRQSVAAVVCHHCIQDTWQPQSTQPRALHFKFLPLSYRSTNNVRATTERQRRGLPGSPRRLNGSRRPRRTLTRRRRRAILVLWRERVRSRLKRWGDIDDSERRAYPAFQSTQGVVMSDTYLQQLRHHGRDAGTICSTPGPCVCIDEDNNASTSVFIFTWTILVQILGLVLEIQFSF
ncbi:hypothetical protein JAAARDRAFT_433770 [Jaapia argillacea MUCL 33604]|uniref:Uncharacterized protein n=1 Tax=Jaapia argillacea MUCL 33604 TaxID=933084 RepID=A0A067PEZ5_9AGAM|nr:hypothetical protein JAAARDRAFT_433770 [Jaapia argillacea MUCL 33604]